MGSQVLLNNRRQQAATRVMRSTTKMKAKLQRAHCYYYIGRAVVVLLRCIRLPPRRHALELLCYFLVFHFLYHQHPGPPPRRVQISNLPTKLSSFPSSWALLSGPQPHTAPEPGPLPTLPTDGPGCLLRWDRAVSI